VKNPLLFSVLALCLGLLPTVGKASPCNQSGYLVGAATDDITGPIVGVGMMGYADLGQFDEGLHMRLRARSMVVSDACGQATVALVIDDISMTFYSVKQAVVDRLDRQLPGVFNHGNVLLSATHTHAGPGGYAHRLLYNITTGGYSPETFNAIVDGTVRSIVRAYKQRQAAQLSVVQGELGGVQFNRSPEAYLNNPLEERQRYATDTDRGMLLLKAQTPEGVPIAAFNWFAVHGVSLPLTNKLVSGDNKGLAAYLFERRMGANYVDTSSPQFVAGFEQANAGDISPYDPDDKAAASSDGFARNQESAEAQFGKAWDLFQRTDGLVLSGPVAAVHRFEDLANKPVSERFAGFVGGRTCNGVLGVSFAAGTKNGKPFPIFPDHAIYGKNWLPITLMAAEQDCHKQKVLLLPTGFVRPTSWTANTAPFQIVRIGELAVIATPFEITTMAGRRLKQQVLQTLANSGVKFVALSGLANEYLHYVTTAEEYAVQSYEGGATLFGPLSLAAYTEIFDQMAVDLGTGRQRSGAVAPPDLSAEQVVLPHQVLFDLPPLGSNYGDVKVDALSLYHRGDAAKVDFWGAHPNNSLAPNKSFLTVEQWLNERWEVKLYDWDPETTFHWQRVGLAGSLISVVWHLAPDTEFGTYRICHSGIAKTPLTGEASPYHRCSRQFKVGV